MPRNALLTTRITQTHERQQPFVLSHPRSALLQQQPKNSVDSSSRRGKASVLVPLAIWAMFFAGLSLQLFSPHLKIVHDAFVIPPDAFNHGLPIDPRALIRRERTIQISSALLAFAGAAGLAFYYRRILSLQLLGQK